MISRPQRAKKPFIQRKGVLTVEHNGDDKEYVPYQAYLIRLWPTRRERVRDYWISLQNVATGEREEFPSLEQFISFIETQKDQLVSFHSDNLEPKPSS